ncbi:MAG: DUF11 domain-containing protein, partial [Chloroflexi bacterium]|nr:DUF11 domain-containing protein [Chloroflexota bacterium]
LLVVSMLVIAPALPAQAGSYVVSNLNDSDAGSLREAITAAPASPEDDTITFSVSGTINLLTALPDLVSGGELTIDGTGQTITISGPGTCRVFMSQITLNLINLTVTNGYVNSQGAGIFNNGGTLNVTNCTVSGNNAGNGGGGIYNSGGTTNIINSTITGNSAGGSPMGGGVASMSGSVTIVNSTLSNNTGDGVGVMEDLDVTHSTIVSNTTGVQNYAFSGNTVTLRNTIVASNTTNCNAGMVGITDGGYNLVWGDTTCPGTNADPKLLSLADNGGPTWTHALDNGSAALEQIPSGTNGCGTTYTTDQRGETRPFPANGSCDIGAYEKIPTTALVLTKSVNPSSAKPGEAITYTIAFSNTSAMTATNVIITDTVPVSVTNAAYSSSGVALTQVPGSHYVWTAPDLAQGDGGVITITGVLGKPLAAGTIPNVVTLAVSGTVQTANADLTVQNVAPIADAGIDQSVGVSETVTLNGGGSDDNGDTLTYGWVQTGGPAVTLSSSTTISPTFSAPATSTIVTFTLTVTDTHGLASTPDEVVITVSEQALEADLSITKSAHAIGHDLTFTITVRNLGPDVASGALVSDTMAANFTNVTWTCVASGGAACGAASGTGDIQDTLSAFPVGGLVTYTVPCTLAYWGTYENAAEIIVPAGVSDPDTSNNRAVYKRYQIIFPMIYKNWTP